MRTDRIFRRYEGNPILSPEKWPYLANGVFNPGVVRLNGETLLLVRVEDMQGFSHFTKAKSKDGKTNWRIALQPTLKPDRDFPEEQYGLEDPRIVWLEEKKEYAITYVSFSKVGPLVSLIMTEDFQTFERKGSLFPPEDKDASLFPQRFENGFRKGRFALIHRPIVGGEGHIWISFSPDLKHWGDHKILLSPKPGYWDSYRVGLGPPPIKTPQGWLIIYHGIQETASGKLYRIGLALLDLDQPWRVIRRSEEWIFSPQEMYEQRGNVSGVVFPCGCVVQGDEIRLYYGGADKVVGLAIGKMDEIMNLLL